MRGGLYGAMQMAGQMGGMRRRRREAAMGARQSVGPHGMAQRGGMSDVFGGGGGLGRQGAMQMRQARGIGQFRDRGLQAQGVPQGAFANRDAYRASFGQNYRQRHPWASLGGPGGLSNFSDPSDMGRAIGPGHPSDQSRMDFFDRERALPQQQAQEELLRRRLLMAQQQRMGAGGLPLY